MATVNILGVNASLAGLGAVLLLASTGLGACAHHPLDCAAGIPHADCREGTRGYNNGGGQAAAGRKTKVWMDGVATALGQADVACANAMQSPELDPIRHKIELDRAHADLPPPFEMSVNNGFPSEEDLPVIARWASVREACLRRARAALVVPPTATPLQAAYLEQKWSYLGDSAARVSELIVGLYEGKLTYGEFAQKRYEIDAATLAAERQFDQANAVADQQRQIQLAQEAREDFQAKLKAWALYNQTIKDRKPQTVGVHGTCTTSRTLSGAIQTTCN
jgi:hypothetical protein